MGWLGPNTARQTNRSVSIIITIIIIIIIIIITMFTEKPVFKSNSVDPDHKPRFGASDLDLHWLPITFCVTVCMWREGAYIASDFIFNFREIKFLTVSHKYIPIYYSRLSFRRCQEVINVGVIELHFITAIKYLLVL